nr:fasciclin domain-containing protein [uncultured Bacteroides sp.]
MKNITLTKRMLWVLLLPLLSLWGCDDKMSEHYEVPTWLKGSAWEVLEEKGNYTIFLEAIEKAGYRPLMEGKSILTVMAPDDAVFTTYLKGHAYTSVADIEEVELKKLIGFHLLYYSYNKERMENFRPDGDSESDEDKLVNAGLYYKFRTRSSSKPTVEQDGTTGKKMTIYHLERFLPVFSHYFFQTKGIDAKTNYEYFYPNSTWKGDNGFNVSNASVSEYAIIADNGYIYSIDQVLEPLETIYTELEKRDNYSEFLNLYDIYSTYEYDKTLSDDYGKAIGVDSLYLHKHGISLPPIAMEWPVSSYQYVRSLSAISYSVFAPSNKALNDFFTRFWDKGGYESLNDIDPLVMKHLLNQFVYGGSVVFPEEINKGEIKNAYGMKISFNTASITDRVMCVNGSLYGMNSMDTPPLFASVAGPAFRDKNSANYLYVLDGSSLMNSLVSDDANFTVLIPTNQQLQESGIYLMNYSTGSMLQIQTTDGWSNLGSAAMQQIVNMHSVNAVAGLKTTGTQVCPLQSAFNYWFVKDGRITCNALFNQCIEPEYNGDPFVPFTEITNNGTAWSNGKAYAYNYNALFEADNSDGLKHDLAACNDQRYPYYAFVQLMKKAGMISGTFIQGLGGRFAAFIPTNEAVEAGLAAGVIPGITNGKFTNGVLEGTVNAILLSSYLRSYFITSELNVLTTYPYPGSPMKSASYQTPGMSALMYTDNGSSLSVNLAGYSRMGHVISKYYYFPFAYYDGCFHLIDAVL